MKLCKMLLAGLLAVVMLTSLCACAGGGTSHDGGTTTTTKNTTTTTTKVDDGKVTYTVTVTDEQGNPLTSTMLQLCKDACIPAVVDANGTATWTVAEDDYKVSFLDLPDGYTYTTDQTEFYFADGETSMTIVLKAEA